jgi:hypothetical protein
VTFGTFHDGFARPASVHSVALVTPAVGPLTFIDDTPATRTTYESGHPASTSATGRGHPDSVRPADGSLIFVDESLDKSRPSASSNLAAEVLTYFCPVDGCGKRYTRSSTLKSHLRRVHDLQRDRPNVERPEADDDHEDDAVPDERNWYLLSLNPISHCCV